MHTSRTLLLLAALFAGSVFAAQSTIDDDFMRTVEDTHKSLTGNVGISNAPGSIADARELAVMFAQIEAFYVDKGDAPDAVTLSRQSRELSDAIVKSAGRQDFETANLKTTELSRACKSCHNFYKKS
ncbi:MAG: hypothetical protein H6R15_3504 [Proteobacteria bacterium]|nr:hypothetical protein [Pseudomonadota bacterium]